LDLRNPIKIINIPSHCQAVGRNVRLVTESAVAVCGSKNREGFVHVRIKSRNSLPTFEKKQDYFAEK
jgi:hypothetical protein